MTKVADSRSKGWWSANWKWVVPVGCLGIMVGWIAFLAGVVALVGGSMRSTWAYKEGVRLATEHPDVVAALGEPITPGWLFGGSISISGPSGEADISVPLRGPAGRGTLYVIARKRAGRWEFELAEVAVDGRPDRIDLLSQRGDRVSSNLLKLAVTRLAFARAAPAA